MGSLKHMYLVEKDGHYIWNRSTWWSKKTWDKLFFDIDNNPAKFKFSSYASTAVDQVLVFLMKQKDRS